MEENNRRKDNELSFGKFPDNFMWCAATAAHQIEGAALSNGKGESIWNEFEKGIGNILDGSNSNIACDSYHLYQQDIKIIKELGLRYYRFSISWPRILPDGIDTLINFEGIQYYNNLIDGLIKADISPIVTLYHWDLPQILQNDGGWANKRIIQLFDNYARICFDNFGDRVKFWITINEPICITWLGHGLGLHAPGIRDPMTTAFTVAHNIILSHVKVWKTYDSKYRNLQHGKVGITINSEWGEPNNWLDIDDIEASERFMLFKLGWFADPIFRNGDYPDILKAQSNKIALFTDSSPLPKFTEQQIKENRGSYDFFGLNHYTSRLVKKLAKPTDYQSEEEMFTNVTESVDTTWRLAESPWLYEAPFGMRRLLNWIKYRYLNPPIFITENGTSDGSGELNDQFRINYHKQYISQVHKAINEDSVNVIGYTVWSLIDNFEWERGYLERFGLYHVDFNNPNRPRTPKKSALFYAEIIENNGINILDENISNNEISIQKAQNQQMKIAENNDKNTTNSLDTETDIIQKKNLLAINNFIEDEHSFKYKL